MKISYNWLKNYLDINLDAKIVAQYLTDCGLEVETIEHYESIKGGLKGFVIGEVITQQKHPDADRLSLTTVNIGEKELLSIVCGAPNVAAGQKVVVATIGTIIYSEKGDFEIKKSKIRGSVSEGMICAEDEIGIGSSHDGILVLDSNAVVGTKAKDFFQITEDFIFEIGLTPNRIDAVSHLGVARDLAAVLTVNRIPCKLNFPSVEQFGIDNETLSIDVVIEDYLACPRYSGITLSGIKVKDSPKWLQDRLKSVGLRPINNVVDCANFVMLETGQPLHAFNTEKITGNKVIVKTLADKTPFVTLDEQERKLSSNDLMICNTMEGMCIAGVFGGLRSGVDIDTKNIFIESACFNPGVVRKTSKYHGLKTDASFRFERGSDPEMTLYALKRASLLIKEIAGGSISSQIVDIYPSPIEWKNIRISYSNVYSLIGKIIEKEKIQSILVSLGIKINNTDLDGLNISIPPFKVDVQRESDVIEEILRIYGYNNIETPTSVKMSVTYSDKVDKEKIYNTIADYLSNNGFHETINNSLTKSEYYSNNKDFKESDSVKILNPLSKELNVMRQTLLYGGLETIAYNQNRQTPDVRIFEFGKSYHFHSSENTHIKKYEEKAHLVIFISGKKLPENWFNKDASSDVFLLKSYVDSIMQKTGIDSKKIILQKSKADYYEDGIEYSINKITVCEFGFLNKSALSIVDVKQKVYFADINWNEIIRLFALKPVSYSEVSKYPEVRRDLALQLDKNISFNEIENLSYEIEKENLISVGLFDVYEGEKIEAGKKSYAISFVLQDKFATLTDKKIEKIMSKLIKGFQEKLNAVIR